MLTLQRMRNWEKALLLPLFILICLSFGISPTMLGCADQRDARAVGKILDEEVDGVEYARYREHYMVLYNLCRVSQPYDWELANMLGMIQRYQQQQNRNYLEEMMEAVRPQSETNFPWVFAVMVRSADNWGIAVSDQELAKRIESVFDIGNGFDQSFYQKVLRNFLQVDTSTFEDAFREFMVFERMVKWLLNASVPNKTEIYNNYKLDNEERKFQYIQVDPARFSEEVSAEIKDEDLERYFTLNLNTKYSENRKVKLRIASIDYDRLADQVSVDDAKVEEFYHRYKEQLYVKESFDISDAPDGSRPAQQKTYYSLDEKRGEIRRTLQLEQAPLQALEMARQGHDEIARLLQERADAIKNEEEKRREEENGGTNNENGTNEEKPENNNQAPEQPVEDPQKKTLVPPGQLVETKDNPYSFAFDILSGMFGEKVRVLDTDYFDTLKIGDVDALTDFNVKKFSDSARTLKNDQISEIIQSGDRVFFFQVISERTAGKRPFYEQKDQVRLDYIDEKALDKAFELARKLSDDLNKESADMATVAAQHNLSVIETEFLKRNKEARSLPKNDKLTNRVFGLKVGHIQAEKQANHAYVLKITTQKFPEPIDLPQGYIEQESARIMRTSGRAQAKDIVMTMLSARHTEFYLKKQEPSLESPNS